MLIFCPILGLFFKLLDHDRYCDREFDKFVASVLKILSGLVIFLFHQTGLNFSHLLSHSFGTNVCEILKRLSEP